MATGNLFRSSKGILPLLVFLMMLLLPATSAAQEPVDRRFGVVDSFVNTAEASAARVGWTRVFFRWDVIQPGGPSDWKPANVPDPFIDAEVVAGREIAAVLIGTPSWATESGTSTAVPPIEYWGDFVYKMANQYKGRVTHWIIWNQPNVTDPALPGRTWDGNEADYYRLLKEAYQKIKSVDPAMQVHIAGLTQTDLEYLPRLLDQIVADPEAANHNYFFDAVSYHLYYSPVQMMETLKYGRSVLDAHGMGQKPIWINETNAPPSEDFIEQPTASAGVKVNLDEQAYFVIQAFALSLAGGAERIAFNKMRNDWSSDAFGLLRADDSRRPAFEAFKTAATYFAGVQQANWLQMGDIHIVTLDRGGETTTVLWNAGSTPTSYSVNAIASQALLIDERGNSQSISAANGAYTIELPGAICSNGANCFIGGAPRLVVETGSPDQRAPLLPLAQAADAPAPAPPEPAPAPPPAEAEGASDPPPANIPAPEVEAQASPLPPTPTAVPVAVPTQEPLISPPTAIPASINESAPPPAGALPDPEFDPEQAPGEEIAPTGDATPAVIPPVTIGTVLRPDRLLWLFIIGLVVFMVSYGIQVVVWYRMKR